MKIHSTYHSLGDQWQIIRLATRLLCFCSTVVFCMLTVNTAIAQSRTFTGLPGSQYESSGSVRNGLFINGDESYKVVDTASYRTAADIGSSEPGSVAQVGFHSNCRACGTVCGGRCGGTYLSCGNFPNPCNPCCRPYVYAKVEGLYMELDEEGINASRDFTMEEFDFEWAPRITLGAVSDCFRGCELSFTGPLRWEMARTAVDPNFELGTLLTPGLPVDPSDISAFSDADLQFQTYKADYWSVEANRTVFGWEIAKLLAGVRYISFEEEFTYYSQNLTESGLLFSDVDNRLFGLQIGMDLIYPICKHTYSDFRSRLGGFINSAESRVLLDNAGSRIIRAGTKETDISALLEIGGGIRYQLGQMLSVRSGVELWYLTGVASALNQVPFVITPTSGNSLQLGDDLFMLGFSLGAEFKY